MAKISLNLVFGREKKDPAKGFSWVGVVAISTQQTYSFLSAQGGKESKQYVVVMLDSFSVLPPSLNNF